jgi:hypothetical protein
VIFSADLSFTASFIIKLLKEGKTFSASFHARGADGCKVALDVFRLRLKFRVELEKHIREDHGPVAFCASQFPIKLACTIVGALMNGLVLVLCLGFWAFIL